MKTTSSEKALFTKFFRVLCAVSLVALLVPTAALGAPEQESTGTEVTATQAPVQSQATAPSSDDSADAVEPIDSTGSADADNAMGSESSTDPVVTLDSKTPAVSVDSKELAATEGAEDLAAAGAVVNVQSEEKEVQPQAGADLSQYLSNFSFDLLQYIGSGNTPVINENDDLTRFEALGLITEFEVSGVPAGINSGDYFSFRATVPGMSGDSANYTDKPFYVGGVARGTWSTVYTPATTTDPAYITYTITLDDSWHGSSTDLIKAGIKIERFGQNSDNENLDAGGSNKEKDVTVGTETTSVKKHYKVPGYKSNVMPITDKKDAKNSAPRADNTIFWMMGYGWANMAKLCESQGKEFANNGADGVMMNPQDQDNILIDTLSYTDGTTGKTVKALSVSDIVIGSLVCAPISKSDYTGNEGAQIVADQAGDTKGISAWYTRVDGDSGTYATVQDYANALAPRQYGVYTAADGTLSVCVNYGKYGTDDTPTMEWAYGSNWAESLANSAIDKGYAQPGDKAALKSMIEEVYGSGNTLGGHIPYIQLNIEVKYPIFDEDGEITKVAINTVTTSTEAIGTGSKEYIDVFSWGEVLPNSLKVFKYDETTNKALAGATFKLQVGKFNASSNIDWSDYEPLDGKGLLRQTGLDGIAEWHDIQVGSYRIVETAAPAGYTLGADTDAQSGGVVVGTFDHPYVGHPGHTLAVPNTPAKGKLDLTKKIDTALIENNTFYFKVSGPLGYYQVVPLEVAAGTTEKTVSLTDLQPGEYTVTEVKNATGDALEGDRLTTDNYSFTVSGNNTKATVGNDVAPTPVVTITNTKADYAEVTPAASKKLSGTLPAGFSETFTTAITAKTAGAPMPDDTTATAIVNSNAETAFSGFSAITFTDPGTYEYEITEQIGSTLGMIYDNNTYTMKVEVSKAFGVDVTYSAVAPNTTAANKAQIKNTYVTPTAKVTPQATKTLTGTLPNGFSETFTATIAAADSTLNAPLPATTTATTTITNNTETAFSGFGEITYTAPGTYEYYITETKGSTQGMTYDSTVYNMKVVVNNDFTTTVTYSGNNTATDKAQIKNTYVQPKAEVTPAATKTLTGTLPANFSGIFTATVAATTQNAPMPNPATATATVTNNTETAFTGFGTITFTDPGTYEYTITETNDHVAGVTYDATHYTMKVVVANDFSATVTYGENNTATDKAQIKNTYATPVPASVDVTPAATKTLTGTLPAGFSEEFAVTIAAKTANAPMPATTTAKATVTNNTETSLVGFSAITFTAPGTYEYNITETAGTTAGVTYDTNTYVMKVVVDTAMKATVTYSGGTTATDKAQIKNTYVQPKVDVTPAATKTLTGTLPANFSETFTATIAAKSANAPMPATTTAKATVTNNTETPLVGFSAITFTAPGTYEYNITETAGTTAGVTYDTNTYVMKVVVDNDMKATTTYTGNNTAADKAQIKNTYTEPVPGTVTATPVATKTLTGTLPNGFSEEFTATIAAKSANAPMPATTTAKATVTNNTETPLVGFSAITFTAAGTYEYNITETAGTTAGMTYDSNTYVMKVVVSADSQGKLSAVTTYSGGTTATDKAQIKNTYTEPVVPTVDVTGTKNWYDFSDKLGKRPADISLTLLQNGQAMAPQPTPTWVKTAGSDTWTFTYSGLAKSDANGNDFVYTVTESAVPYYFEPSYLDANGNEVQNAMPNGGSISNDINPPTIPRGENDPINLSGIKTWNDNSNATGVRPIQINLTLTDETGAVVSATPVWQTDSTNQWSYLYTGLPQKDAAGNAKTYTVTEDVVPGYFAAEITKVDTGNGNYSYNLTNNLITPTDKTISVVATKVWDDDADAAKTRPASIKFTLLDAQGKECGGTPVWTKNADNTWTCTWTSLPEGTYSVVETPVAGYKAPVYGEAATDANGNITTKVTNTKDQTTPKPSTTPASSTATTKASTAKTADTTPLAPLGGVIAVSVVALFFAARRIRSN